MDAIRKLLANVIAPGLEVLAVAAADTKVIPGTRRTRGKSL